MQGAKIRYQINGQCACLGSRSLVFGQYVTWRESQAEAPSTRHRSRGLKSTTAFGRQSVRQKQGNFPADRHKALLRQDVRKNAGARICSVILGQPTLECQGQAAFPDRKALAPLAPNHLLSLLCKTLISQVAVTISSSITTLYFACRERSDKPAAQQYFSVEGNAHHDERQTIFFRPPGYQFRGRAVTESTI